jgi:hypothetical protein
MSRYHVLALAVVALALAGQPVLAQTTINYEFANSAGVPTNAFTVLQGQKVSVRVYLHELTPGAPLMTDTGGMGSGAVRVTYIPATTASIAVLSDISTAAAPNGPWTFGNTFLDTTPPTPPQNYAVPSGRVANASFVSGSVVPDATGRIFLGTFTLTGNALGSVTLAAIDPNTTSTADNVTFSGASLDGSIASGSATLLVVSAVPEPGTLALAGVGFAGLVAYRRRRVTKS